MNNTVQDYTVRIRRETQGPGGLKALQRRTDCISLIRKEKLHEEGGTWCLVMPWTPNSLEKKHRGTYIAERISRVLEE